MKMLGIEKFILVIILVLFVGAVVLGLAIHAQLVEVVKTGMIENIDLSTSGKVIILWQDKTKSILNSFLVDSNLSFNKNDTYTLQRVGLFYSIITTEK